MRGKTHDITVVLSPSDEELYAKMKSWAITSLITEQKGADILIFSKNGICGIQRKSVPTDLILSLQDGRLSRETTLLRDSCAVAFLVPEGRMRYYPDGTVVSNTKKVTYRWTKRSIRKALWEISTVKGVIIQPTEDLDDTVEFIRDMVDFMNADNHLLTFKRPGCPAQWGTPTMDEMTLWILQGFPGIGVGLARKVMESFGSVPLAWMCDLEDLKKVPGIGRNRAEKLWNMLPLSQVGTSRTKR